MTIIGNEIKRIINGQNFWEILERIIGKISSIIGAGLKSTCILAIFHFGAPTIDIFEVTTASNLVSSPDRFFPFLFGAVTKQKRKKAVWGRDYIQPSGNC